MSDSLSPKTIYVARGASGIEKPPDSTVARRYLLGELPETAQRRVEESFLLDLDYKEQMLIAEDELIEDYLDDLLGEQERRKFVIYFMATPPQQEKVRNVRLLREGIAELRKKKGESKRL